MSLKPYPSISKIAARAAREGYVVGVETGQTVIETGTTKIIFHQDKKITTGANEEISMDEALKRLKIDLAS